MARNKPKPRRLKFRRLLQCGALVLAGGLAVFACHQLSPPATQERIEAVTLDVIDLVRENRSAPRELVFWLDLLADRIPLARGKVVAAGVSVEDGAMALGGTPASTRTLEFLKNTGYLAGYDEQMRNPAWVAYRVFPPKYPSGKRPDKFDADPRTRARVETSAYTNSGYDRGHMAPNRAIAVCYGTQAQQETFLMSNVVPQRHGLNGAFWEAMESRVIERYTRRFGEVWILCGPVYNAATAAGGGASVGSGRRTIGGGVAVPDAFFLIIAERDKGAVKGAAGPQDAVRVEAFLVPHRDISAKEEPSKFLVSIREIEQRTGLDFFPLLSRETQDALETAAAKRAW